MREWTVLCTLLVLLTFLDILRCTHLPIPEKKLNFIEAVHRQANYNDHGIWKNHVEWKARWVKEWHEKRIIVPVWKKVWGPIEINEWVPLPNIPSWNPHEQKNENNT